MIKKYWDDPVYRFLMKAVLLYALWYIAYQQLLKHITNIDLAVIRNLEFLSGWILENTGYTLIAESEIASVRTIGIDGTHGLWIGDPCNGLTLFALFTGFLLAYPGPWKKKLWFIPFGLITIHALNVLRIVGLALTVYYFPDPEVLDFNHTYTFTILVYGYVFFLWYLWAVKLSGVNMKISPSDD
ncbi:MAG: archaeosortase/exosortase family protein [Salibacteraceae bacterium]